MRTLGFSRLTWIWLLLVAATLLSVESSAAHGDHRLLSTAIIVIACIKVRLIGLNFMELRTAPRVLRSIFEGWLLLIGSVLLLIYWLRPAVV